MSTTTQILFNSPALHSLKRNQLVKLCKIHSLKASGKSKELIERLKFHAKTLPSDDPLSVAVRSDNPSAKPAADSEDEVSTQSEDANTPVADTVARPSEQWEVVMDTIAEVDEETLRSNRGISDRQVSEFGTNTSKVSVTSSLRAIANSLGLKRSMSKNIGITSSSSSLSSGEVAQSSSTLPISDSKGGLEEPPMEPIPGQSNLQGLPVPSDARLSPSQAPATTTIRLVSNSTTNPELLLSPPKLQPFTTSFDLVPDTPGSSGGPSVPVWPFSPGGAPRQSLYPPIPTFEGLSALLKQHSHPSAQHDHSDMDIDVPGGLVAVSIPQPTPEKPNASVRFNTGATHKSTEKPSTGPADIFSPAPKPQNASTRSRPGIPRSEPFVFGSQLPHHNMSNFQFRTAAQSVLDEMNKRLAEAGVDAVDADVLSNRRTATEESIQKLGVDTSLRARDIFEKIHRKEFEKMDSITSHYAAKRGAPSAAPQPILSKKRKSSLAVKERNPGVPAARHRPNGSRVVSGASVKTLPGRFGEEGDEDDENADKRLSKRLRVERDELNAPAQPDGISQAPIPDPEEEVQKQKEREAIRRRLEHNKAKRRSSMGRQSLGRAPPPKPARLGIFASTKSLVQNVWNRGAGSKASSSMPVSKLAQSRAGTKAPPKPTEVRKTAVIPGSSGAPPLNSQTKRIPSGGSNTSVNASGRSTPAARVDSGEGGATVTSSGTLKSPFPLHHPPDANTRSSTVAGHGSRATSLVGFSSLGTRAGLSVINSRVSLMGTKSNIRATTANLQKHTTYIPRARTSSTLMAPTASSLAKTNTYLHITPSNASHNENLAFTKASASSKQQLTTSPAPGATLEQITNSPRSPIHSSHPAKIFSQPLGPAPAQPPVSLAATATSIVGQIAKEKPIPSLKPLIPSKSKVLPGRRPRISRSKVIARLASQRATDTSSSASAGTERAGGKVRSSMSAEVAGKTRQSYGGARSGNVMMSAKKRVRQSEHARRKSRTNIVSAGQKMDVD